MFESWLRPCSARTFAPNACPAPQAGSHCTCSGASGFFSSPSRKSSADSHCRRIRRDAERFGDLHDVQHVAREVDVARGARSGPVAEAAIAALIARQTRASSVVRARAVVGRGDPCPCRTPRRDRRRAAAPAPPTPSARRSRTGSRRDSARLRRGPTSAVDASSTLRPPGAGQDAGRHRKALDRARVGVAERRACVSSGAGAPTRQRRLERVGFLPSRTVICTRARADGRGPTASKRTGSLRARRQRQRSVTGCRRTAARRDRGCGS